MSVLVWLVPIALLMGAVGLAAFFWSIKSGQYDDLSGAAERILLADDDHPLPGNARTDPRFGTDLRTSIQPAKSEHGRRCWRLVRWR